MASKRPKTNKEREERIASEIVVDCHDSDERVLGWYYYLDDRLRFPFTATCVAERVTSPLRRGDEVEVSGMAGEDACPHEMYVLIRWDRKQGLAVPLSQLKPGPDADEQTQEAVADWHYWVGMGYEF